MIGLCVVVVRQLARSAISVQGRLLVLHVCRRLASGALREQERLLGFQPQFQFGQHLHRVFLPNRLLIIGRQPLASRSILKSC